MLYGSDQLRLTIDRDGDVGALVRSWEPEEEAFRKLRQPFLMHLMCSPRPEGRGPRRGARPDLKVGPTTLVLA